MQRNTVKFQKFLKKAKNCEKIVEKILVQLVDIRGWNLKDK